MHPTANFLTRRILPVLALSMLGSFNVRAVPTAAYPQPQPSNQEQYLLELINVARANPAAEGQMLANITDPEILRYYQHYSVNTGAMASQFAGYSARPPLAFNANLMASSLAQSQYQASSGVQTHTSADGTTFDKRISAAGYDWSAVGENVYAYAENPFFGHVGLMADWGVPDLDHRMNLLNTDSSYPVYREIGISAVASGIANFGPLVITEDFGTPASSGTAYLVGVVYGDSNNNGAYDEGEGLGGVTVTPDGTNYYAVSTATGGFVIPLPTSGSGTLTITAAGGGLGGARVKTVNYTAGTNVKVDFTTADPVVTAPALPALPVVAMTANSTAAKVSGKFGKVTVSRSGDLSQSLSVALNFGGNAVNGVDFAPLPSTLMLAAGTSSATLKIRATDSGDTTTKKLKVSVVPAASYTITADKVKTQAKIKIIAD